MPFDAPSPDLIDRFRAIVGDAHALTDPNDQQPYLVEWRDKYLGRTPVVLRPGSVGEVSAILALANETHTAIVPQGGNTGLVGGQIPVESGEEVVVSLSRLNRVREVDPRGNTMTVEAGVTLAACQDAADEVDRLFPLSLGSQGTCQIGGNISTNAGGTAVLAYGNTRELVMGLEVVLADGTVWNGLRGLRKDNTGYDLKDLFIGAEGTLGIVTAAVLKLLPKPRARETAFIGLASPHQALDLLNRAQAAAGPALVSFELMPRVLIDFCLKHLPGARDPIDTRHDWYVLAEMASGVDDGRIRSLMETVLADAFEDEIVENAVLAENSRQAADFWAMRHGMSEVQKHEGGSIKHDVSVRVADVPDFLDRAIAACEATIDGCRPVPFGHLGDGNIHFNISQPVGGDKAAFLARWEELARIVHGIVTEMGGSIS
ncbi:MAG: FAD-binding oxidoreductase, partial [Rhodobiaceae bacterium]|nr:FAD-binding oxidoreductase [Rhodobiaceae bacterium]